MAVLTTHVNLIDLPGGSARVLAIAIAGDDDSFETVGTRSLGSLDTRRTAGLLKQSLGTAPLLLDARGADRSE
jgi:hypothetical protein